VLYVSAVIYLDRLGNQAGIQLFTTRTSAVIHIRLHPIDSHAPNDINPSRVALSHLLLMLTITNHVDINLSSQGKTLQCPSKFATSTPKWITGIRIPNGEIGGSFRIYAENGYSLCCTVCPVLLDLRIMC
jgi:hypothetical protein